MIGVAYRSNDDVYAIQAGARAGPTRGMTRLWLLRHAKAGPYSADDFSRALAPRGRKNAPAMGEKLAVIGCAPKLVLCSAGRRAVETMCGVLPWLPADLNVAVMHGLYTFSPGAILQCLRRVPEDAGDIMVVGHNPALQELALYLAGDGEDDAFAILHGKFPTCAVAELEFSEPPFGGDWGQGSAYLRSVLTPRPPRDLRMPLAD